MYVNRHVEESVRNLAEMVGAVLVIGPRQVGKTTMLKRVASEAKYVTLDDPLLLASAAEV